jgi:hypothetical protein
MVTGQLEKVPIIVQNRSSVKNAQRRKNWRFWLIVVLAAIVAAAASIAALVGWSALKKLFDLV